MALRIRASSFFTARILTVDAKGVTHLESAFVGGKRKFQFSEIDAVLMSSKSVLSFQVGNEVFSIPTKPGNRRHQEVIATLVGNVHAANSAGRTNF